MRTGKNGLLGVAVGAIALLGACGVDAPSRAELVRSLELTGLPSDQAECAADAVLDTLSDDEVVELVERGPAGAPRDDPDRSDDTSDRVRAALAACRVEASTTTTPEGTGEVGGGSTSSTSSTSSTAVADDPDTSAPATSEPATSDPATTEEPG